MKPTTPGEQLAIDEQVVSGGVRLCKYNLKLHVEVTDGHADSRARVTKAPAVAIGVAPGHPPLVEVEPEPNEKVKPRLSVVWTCLNRV